MNFIINSSLENVTAYDNRMESVREESTLRDTTIKSQMESKKPSPKHEETPIKSPVNRIVIEEESKDEQTKKDSSPRSEKTKESPDLDESAPYKFQKSLTQGT